MNTVTVSKTIRTPWNTSGYEYIVRGVLGSRYTLSIVLIGDKRSHTLNNDYRKKDKPTNVLTFPLDTTSAEIFINIAQVRRDAKKNGFSKSNYAKYLLIHGCLHLKGYTHGSTMEKAEDAFIKKYNLR